MSGEIVSGHSFVRPYFIQDLGDDGLMAADIAKSLGARPDDVRKKLVDRGFLDRIKAQGFQATAVAVVNKNNGLQYTEYVLDTAAAKFFVGKYDSEMGDSYLAFLIRLESNVNELDILTRNDPILRQIAATQQMRLMQIQQEKRIEALEAKTEDIHASVLDCILSVPQKSSLKGLIDSRARALGDIRFAGYIQKDLKQRFELNSSNDKWYHIRQRDYGNACDFVSNWGLCTTNFVRN